MDYFLISVSTDGKPSLLKIKKDEITMFFINESGVFSGKLSEMKLESIREIKAILGSTEKLGFAHVFKVVELAPGHSKLHQGSTKKSFLPLSCRQKINYKPASDWMPAFFRL